MEGPFSIEQLKEQLGPLFTVSRRFGIRQGDKVRMIDDLSDSLVNTAFGASECIDLGGVNGLAVLARTFLEMVSDDKCFRVDLSDGTVLSGWLHSSLTVPQARHLVGRTLDLEFAQSWWQEPAARQRW